jgi:hypothetical protein
VIDLLIGINVAAIGGGGGDKGQEWSEPQHSATIATGGLRAFHSGGEPALAAHNATIAAWLWAIWSGLRRHGEGRALDAELLGGGHADGVGQKKERHGGGDAENQRDMLLPFDRADK